MQKISKDTAGILIESSQAKIFSCEFVKRTTGELRTIRGRYGPSVQKGVKGVGLSFSPSEKGLIPVYLMSGDPNRADEATENRRFISIEGIRRLKINGETFEVN